MGYYYSLTKFDPIKQKKNAILTIVAPVLAHGIYDSILFTMEVSPALSGVLTILFLFFCHRMWKSGSRRIAEHIAHDADCIIFIVDGEIGDKTLHEFNIALKVYGEKRRPSIYVYNNVNGKSHPQADTFINKVAREGHYWRLYSNVMDLRLKFKEDITNELIGKYV